MHECLHRSVNGRHGDLNDTQVGTGRRQGTCRRTGMLPSLCFVMWINDIKTSSYYFLGNGGQCRERLALFIHVESFPSEILESVC